MAPESMLQKEKLRAEKYKLLFFFFLDYYFRIFCQLSVTKMKSKRNILSCLAFTERSPKMTKTGQSLG